MCLIFCMSIISFNNLILRMKKIQGIFLHEQGVNDIWSNSKVYEILVANSLNHDLIPGHSGSRDAKDSNNTEYEGKLAVSSSIVTVFLNTETPSTSHLLLA